MTPPASRPTLVLPMSAVALWKRCPTAFWLGYENMLEPIVTKDYVVDGSSFHAHMAAYAWERRGLPVPPELLAKVNGSSDAMYDVALDYIRNRGAEYFDQMSEIIAADRESEAVYLPVTLPGSMEQIITSAYAAREWYVPSVYIRMTHDLVCRKNDGWIYARDYKTFSRMPSYDYDLDFQGRLYTAGLMMRFQTENVHFDFENVRRERPAPITKWRLDECYASQPLVISLDEARRLWRETQFDVARILLARLGGRDAYSHTDLKGTSPHTCHTCFYKDLCKRDYTGTLDDEAVEELATRRKPIVLPEGAVV